MEGITILCAGGRAGEAGTGSREPGVALDIWTFSGEVLDHRVLAKNTGFAPK